MSGGSFNYLFRQDPYSPTELEAMAKWLDDYEMHLAAFETRQFIHRADEQLADLWHAVEWMTSGDWTFDEVWEAHEAFLKSRRGQ